jgi:hypothetical protein
MVMIVAVAATLIANQSQAQTPSHLLRGLSQVQVVIEKLHGGSKECGLTEASIRDAIMYPLSSSRVEVVRNSDVAFYVKVNTLYSKELCFSSVSLEVFTYHYVTLKWFGDTTGARRAEVRLWDPPGVIDYSSPSSHAQRILNEIENSVKRFITDWNLDNKPSTAKN